MPENGLNSIQWSPFSLFPLGPQLHKSDKSVTHSEILFKELCQPVLGSRGSRGFSFIFFTPNCNLKGSYNGQLKKKLQIFFDETSVLMQDVKMFLFNKIVDRLKMLKVQIHADLIFIKWNNLVPFCR